MRSFSATGPYPAGHGGTWHSRVVEMTLRFEIFPDDLDAIVDFYMRVLDFRLIADQRAGPGAYVALERGQVRVGAARRAVPGARAARRPPAGAARVLDVDDAEGGRDWVVAGGGAPRR